MPEGFSSPVAAGDYLYRLHGPGRAPLHPDWRPARWSTPNGWPGVSTAASPVATADGRVYLASAGKSYVVKAGPEFEVLATNDLGDGGPASPAVADGRLYLKGRQCLFCIGKKY